MKNKKSNADICNLVKSISKKNVFVEVHLGGKSFEEIFDKIITNNSKLNNT